MKTPCWRSFDSWPIPLIYFLQPLRISKANTNNGSVWITEQTLAGSRPGLHAENELKGVGYWKGGGPTAETQMAIKLERLCKQWLPITCLCRWSKAIKESLKAAHSNGQGSRFPLQRLNTTKTTKWKHTVYSIHHVYICIIDMYVCVLFCSLLSGSFILKASEIVGLSIRHVLMCQPGHSARQ